MVFNRLLERILFMNNLSKFYLNLLSFHTTKVNTSKCYVRRKRSPHNTQFIAFEILTAVYLIVSFDLTTMLFAVVIGAHMTGSTFTTKLVYYTEMDFGLRYSCRS